MELESIRFDSDPASPSHRTKLHPVQFRVLETQEENITTRRRGNLTRSVVVFKTRCYAGRLKCQDCWASKV